MTERLLLAALAIWIAAPLLAGPWETFERVCLLPMEAGNAPVADGLVRESSDGTAESPYEMAFYRDAEGRMVSVSREGNARICGVIAQVEEAGAVALAYTRWLEAAFGSGRYTTTKPFEVKSTGWRDPALIVQYNPGGGGGGARLSVGEWPADE